MKCTKNRKDTCKQNHNARETTLSTSWDWLGPQVLLKGYLFCLPPSPLVN